LLQSVVKGLACAFPLHIDKNKSQDAAINQYLLPMLNHALSHLKKKHAPMLQGLGFDIKLPCDDESFAAAVKKYKKTDQSYTERVNWGLLELWLMAYASRTFFGADSKVVGFIVINTSERPPGNKGGMPGVHLVSSKEFDQWEVEIAVNYCPYGDDHIPKHYESFYEQIGAQRRFSWDVSHSSIAQRNQRIQAMKEAALARREAEDDTLGRGEWLPDRK
jgi:hypothetical protein